MVFLEEVIDNLFQLTRDLYDDQDRSDPLTDEQKTDRFTLAKQASVSNIVLRLLVCKLDNGFICSVLSSKGCS